VQDAFKTLDHVVERMNRLMHQLKNSSLAAALQEVDLAAVITEVKSARLCQLPHVTVIGAKDPVVVRANRDRLFSAFEHVVHNAQDAAGKYGRVTIRVETEEGDLVVVEVEDTGPGMTAEFIRTRLFKPFDTTKGLTGMGIGAYESREYVRSLGGEVLVTSEPGKGSCFRITLPRMNTSNLMAQHVKGSA
jgi:signal transduction histidine kinase